MRVSLLEPMPSRLRVGRGTAILLRGGCEHPRGEIRTLRVSSAGAEAPFSVIAGRAGEEWWAIVPIPAPAAPRSVSLELVAELESGGREAAPLGRIELESGLPAEAPADADGRLVAICMATYDPPIELFRRQIESIRAQAWGSWVCVISDDGSSPQRLAEMRRILAGDERFRLAPGTRRLGFYANFERAIELAPAEAAYIALSDQDDSWYPDKLEALVRSLGAGGYLAYGDVRVVGDDGEVLSDTYWKYRRNNSTDLATLLIANTITGSVALFRRELLDYLLPFPPRVGNAFHDHWLAVVALARGPLAYVDRPLQDYVQHAGATFGFSAANKGRGESESALIDAGIRARRVASRIARPQARQRYFDDYCRIAVNATALELRCGEAMDAEKRGAVEEVLAYDRSPRAAAGLAGLSLRSLLGANRTAGVERSLLAALAWRHLGAREGRSRGAGLG